MNNILLNRDTLKVVGRNRSPLPFEVEVKGVDTTNLKKTIPTYEEVPKTVKIEAEGQETRELPLYYLPQVPLEGTTIVDKIVETTEVTDQPAMIIELNELPMLDENGNHRFYYRQELMEVTEVTDEPVMETVYDEEGNPSEVQKTDENGNLLYYKMVDVEKLFLYTTEEVEVQATDENNNPLYLTTVQEEEITVEEQPDLEITSEDEGWAEELEPVMVTVEDSKTITFDDDSNEFTYEDVTRHKESLLIEDTFYDAGMLFEDPQVIVDPTNNLKADLGFGCVSVPSLGEFTTVNIPLDVPTSVVGITIETSVEGLLVEIGDSVTNLAPVNKQNEVIFTTQASQVYVRFHNPTDKRIDLHSFGLLV